jgi:ATP-dependent protease Clp ATPase subunit
MFSRPQPNSPCCAVCKKSEHHVRYLISGGEINICSECITKFNKQIGEQRLVRLRRMFIERLQQPLPSDNIH